MGGRFVTAPVSLKEVNDKLRLEKLKRLYVRPASEVKKVMASPPTITTSASAFATYTTGFPKTVTANSYWSGVVNFYGGWPARVSNRVRLRTVTSDTSKATDPLVTTGFNDGITRMGFRTDAAVVCLQVNTANTLPFRFIIDGEYVSLTGTVAAQTGDSHIKLDFSAVGGRKIREIIIEGPNSWGFSRVFVAATDSVYALPDPMPKIAVMHDSFGAGPVSSQYVTPTPITQDGWVRYFGDALGCNDVWAMAIGGTGFALGNNGTKYHERACDLLNYMPDGVTKKTDWSPDALLIKGSVNDVSQTVSTVTANMATLYDYVRQRDPTIPMIFSGVPWKANGSLSPTQALEAAMRAQVESFMDGDKMVAWVGESETTDMQWVYGTGREGATNSSGNSDYYVGTDSTHPSYAGHEYRGRREALAFVAAIATLRA